MIKAAIKSRIIRILAGALLAGALVSSASAAGERDHTYVDLTTRPWETLDPHNSFDAVSFILTGNVYEPLLIFADTKHLDELRPFLAIRVPTRENGGISAEGLTYDFEIRQGVRFHDGRLLTPDDVRYSLLRFMLADFDGGPSDLLLRPILGVYSTRDAQGRPIDFKKAAEAVAVKGDHVLVHLARPDAAFLKVIASLPIVVSRSWAAEHGEWDGTEATWLKFNQVDPHRSYFNDHMNGTGPFALESADRDQGVAVFKRHDGYWRKPAALERAVFKVVPNAGERFFMLNTGDADGGYLEHSFQAQAAASKSLQVVGREPLTDVGTMLFFNLHVSTQDNERLGSGALDGAGIPSDFFAEADVRRAFAFAFDYEQFRSQALDGRARRTSGPFPRDLMPEAAYVDVGTDLRKAEALFRKAYGGKLWEQGFTLPISFAAGDGTRQAAAEVLQQSLSRLNPRFRVRLDPVPGDQYYPELEAKRLAIFAGGHYNDYPDPQDYAYGLLHSQAYFPTYQGYSNPKLDTLVEQAFAEPLASKRRDLYLQIARLAVEDAPQLYLYSPAGFHACARALKGCGSDQNVANLGYNGFPYFYAFSK